MFRMQPCCCHRPTYIACLRTTREPVTPRSASRQVSSAPSFIRSQIRGIMAYPSTETDWFAKHAVWTQLSFVHLCIFCSYYVCFQSAVVPNARGDLHSCVNQEDNKFHLQIKYIQRSEGKLANNCVVLVGRVRRTFDPPLTPELPRTGLGQ